MRRRTIDLSGERKFLECLLEREKPIMKRMDVWMCLMGGGKINRC